MSGWAAAFFLTQAVEVPIYAWWGRSLAGPRRWAWALGASALTHPLVWAWVSLGPSPWSYVGLVLAGEAFAVAAEGTLGRSLGAPRPWLGALLANGASVGVGMLIRAWTGWP